MIDPKHLAEFDQATAAITEAWPPFLWTFYQRLRQQGFEDTQAFMLTVRLLEGMIAGNRGVKG